MKLIYDFVSGPYFMLALFALGGLLIGAAIYWRQPLNEPEPEEPSWRTVAICCGCFVALLILYWLMS